MTLIKSQGSNTDSSKKGNCHKCGKPGHWANKCSDNANSGASGNRRRMTMDRSGTRTSRQGKHKSWRTIPPPPGTGNSKKVKDRTFNWCEKCRRWTTTHTTATHTGGERRQSSPPTQPSAHLTTLIPEPSVWWVSLHEPTPLWDLLYMFFEFLYDHGGFVLFALLTTFCILAPPLVDLAIYLLVQVDSLVNHPLLDCQRPSSSDDI